MAGNVLITGASGLLGRELVSLLSDRGFPVVAQYHNRRPENLPGKWVFADFSSPQGVSRFLEVHAVLLRDCGFLVHAYGPITSRPLRDLQGDDFIADYHGNVVVCHQIVQALIPMDKLESVVTIGFSDTGLFRPFRRILTHACAKNALLLLTLSLAREFPELHVNMVSLPSLPGARVPAPDGMEPVPTAVAATVVADMLVDGRSGIHLRVTKETPRGEIVHAL